MFAAFLTFIGFLVLLDVGVATQRDSEWWAAWGQWVGGVGSIAAAAVALWVAVEGWRKSDEQAIRQAREIQQLHKEEAASRFAVWIEAAPVTLEDIDIFPASPIQRRARIMFNNAGGLPIYDVVVTARMRSGDLLSWSYAVCPPTIEATRLDDETSNLTPRLIQELREFLLEQHAADDQDALRSRFQSDEVAGLLYFMHGTKLAVEFTDSKRDKMAPYLEWRSDSKRKGSRIEKQASDERA